MIGYAAACGFVKLGVIELVVFGPIFPIAVLGSRRRYRQVGP